MNTSATAAPSPNVILPVTKAAPAVVSLKEYNWEKQGFEQKDYPAEPIAEFVDFFRTTKAWIEDAERVNRQVRKLEKALEAYRVAQASLKGAAHGAT